MINRNRHTLQFKARLLFILFFFVVCYAIIGIRLYVIQVTQSDLFTKLALEQYNAEIEIRPPRATIYDRHHSTPLAFNHEVSSAFILPRQLSEKEKTMNFLKKHFSKAHNIIEKNPKRSFVWVKRNVSSKDKRLLEAYKDINFMPEIVRYYPFPQAEPVVGCTDIDNKGIEGIELKFNKHLGGSPSRIRLEKDARSKNLSFEKQIIREGEHGKSLTLTLDNKLQELAHNELRKSVNNFKADHGCVLILNPENGHILTMTQYHSNNNGTEKKELKNNIVTDCYEFGSVIKTFAALAALQEGVTTSSELIDCEGKATYIDRVRIENWKPLGILPFSDVLRLSSNVGMAKIAKRLGNRMYDNFKKMGFGVKTGIEFPGERSGFVSNPKSWSRSSLLVLSFGYEMNGTLLQLGRAFGIIANNGYDVHPTIILDNKQSQSEKLYDLEAIETLKTMLESDWSRKKLDGYRVLGKTGTARIAQKGGYSTTRHLYSFGGIVEKDGYKRVIITFIKEPRKTNLWASQVAAPLFDRIAEKMVIHDTLSGMA